MEVVVQEDVALTGLSSGILAFSFLLFSSFLLLFSCGGPLDTIGAHFVYPTCGQGSEPTTQE